MHLGAIVGAFPPRCMTLRSGSLQTPARRLFEHVVNQVRLRNGSKHFASTLLYVRAVRDTTATAVCSTIHGTARAVTRPAGASVAGAELLISDMAASGAGALAVGETWHILGAGPQELQLDFCLPTGQSFRWRKTGDNEYTGVIGDRLVCLRQLEDDVAYRVLARGRDAAPAHDAAVLRDYFNLDTRLSSLAEGWAARCSRFRDVSPHFPGARMLRQDPLECLFQFICSSNNHISRIHGMVERLCSAYGTPLEPTDAVRPTGVGVAAEEAPPKAAKRNARTGPRASAGLREAAAGEAAAGTAAAGGPTLSYFAFPDLEQLSRATEEDLRAAGFGYRAKFIVGTTQALLAKPGGGRQWLLGLRQVDLEEAVAALVELPGIGPKVAACICLFSLDKHAAIPVDTHVWQIAVRYYCPQLRGKSLTKKVHGEVQQVFVERFGPYAGWAHNTLFISELASQQHRLPEHLRQGKPAGKSKAATSGGKRRDRGRRNDGSDEDDGDDDDDGGVPKGGKTDNTDVNDGDSRGGEGDEGGGEDDGGDGAPARSRRVRGSAARAASAAQAAAVGEAAAPVRVRGGARRGAQRQPVQDTAAAVAAANPQASGGVDSLGSRGASGSSGSEGHVLACAAVADGQTDLVSPLAGIAVAARKGRSKATERPAVAPVARSTGVRPKRAAAGEVRRGRGCGVSAPQPPAGYELGDFDDLVK